MMNSVVRDFKPWFPSPECAGAGPAVQKPAVAGSCGDSGDAVIDGLQDCGFGLLDMTVAWTTDCKARTVTFDLQAKTGTDGNAWLAIGLYDAGGVSDSARFPSVAM